MSEQATAEIDALWPEPTFTPPPGMDALSSVHALSSVLLDIADEWKCRHDLVCYSAFCLQWVAISWCAVVGKEQS